VEEHTFQVDIPLAETEQQIRRLAEKVWRASRENARGAKTVVLKLKTKEFNSLTRSLTPSPLSSCDELTTVALTLRERVELAPQQLFRLVGVGLSNFNLTWSLLFLRPETFRRVRHYRFSSRDIPRWTISERDVALATPSNNGAIAFSVLSNFA
jgi:hypothetical protein